MPSSSGVDPYFPSFLLGLDGALRENGEQRFGLTARKTAEKVLSWKCRFYQADKLLALCGLAFFWRAESIQSAYLQAPNRFTALGEQWRKRVTCWGGWRKMGGEEGGNSGWKARGFLSPAQQVVRIESIKIQLRSQTRFLLSSSGLFEALGTTESLRRDPSVQEISVIRYFYRITSLNGLAWLAHPHQLAISLLSPN